MISSYFVGIKGAIMMSLIAFSTVFLVCAALMLMMIGLKHITAAMEKASVKHEPATPPTQASAAPVAAAGTTSTVDDDEIVAVITAAIVASCGTTARIASIQPSAKHRGSSPWRMTGILQNSEGFCD